MIKGGKIFSLSRFWVVSTYFAEGFPYSLVRQISTVYFKDAGASLQAIGITSLYGLPWALKLLWAPLVDAFSSKRRWLCTFEFILAAAVFAIAAASSVGTGLAAVALLFLVIAILSATHDIAIDGYYLEALDREEQARFVGYQAMSYRLALIAGGGGIVFLSGKTSWFAGFSAAAAVLLGLACYHSLLLPKGEPAKKPFSEMLSKIFTARVAAWVLGAGAAVVASLHLWVASEWWAPVAPAREWIASVGAPVWIAGFFAGGVIALLAAFPFVKERVRRSDSFYAKAFFGYLDQRRIGVIIAFLLTYRTGESFLLAMVYPFLKEVGITRDLYGIIYGTFGIAASLGGGITGGYIISKYGLKKVIWPMVLSQNALNLFYMGLSWHYREIFGKPELGSANLWLVGSIVVLESFGSGLGTAAFMVFSQRTCKSGFKAAHFAMATGIMNISATFAGILSGFLASAVGFTNYFGITFLATIPGMSLIFFLPYLDGSNADGAPVPSS